LIKAHAEINLASMESVASIRGPMAEHIISNLADKPKTIDRLVTLYMHQNTLLWTRLQTLAALQLPVLAGWYFFYQQSKFPLAACVALLGTILSALIWELFHCDADRRNYLRKKLLEVDQIEGKIIFPDMRTWISGFRVMELIVGLFLAIDSILTLFTAVKVICPHA
jgi:hypothetical protein